MAVLRLEQKAPAACRAGTNGGIEVDVSPAGDFDLLALEGYELLSLDAGLRRGPPQ